MLLFDFFDHVGEEHLHLVFHVVEFRDFGVRIFIKYVFDFSPLHLFTVLVEQSTFLFVIESISTNKTWLTTLRIHTYHKARISIYAFWVVLEMFTSHQYFDWTEAVSINIIS
jgi:hypothetical protein